MHKKQNEKKNNSSNGVRDDDDEKKEGIKCEKNWIKLMDKRTQTEFESSFFLHWTTTFHLVFLFFSSFCINNFQLGSGDDD